MRRRDTQRAVGDLFAQVTEDGADRIVAGELAGLSSVELGARQTSAAYPEAESEVDGACAALQELADEAGAEVDLCVGLYAS